MGEATLCPIARGVHLRVDVKLLLAHGFAGARVDQRDQHLPRHGERGLDGERIASGENPDRRRCRPTTSGRTLRSCLRTGRPPRAGGRRWGGAAEADAAHPGPAHLLREEPHAAQLGSALDGLGKARVGDAVEQRRVPVELARRSHTSSSRRWVTAAARPGTRARRGRRRPHRPALQRLAVASGPALHRAPATARRPPGLASRVCRSRAMAPVFDLARRLPSMTRTFTRSLPASRPAPSRSRRAPRPRRRPRPPPRRDACRRSRPGGR